MLHAVAVRAAGLSKPPAPPCSVYQAGLARLITSRSALRSAVCGIALVMVVVGAGVSCSDPVPGYSIESGDLNWDATEELAVAKLSSGANQESWWQLGKTNWHDSALDRFFTAGPPHANEMKALASQDGNPNSWNAARISSVEPTDLVRALQSLSATTYQMNATITGTGKIQASMWTLMFQCIESSCGHGMLPIVIVRDGDPPFSYAAVWLPLTSTLLINAIPSYIASLPPATPVTSTAPMTEYARDSALSFAINVRDSDLPSCPSTAIAHCRTSLLDGAYGLTPGFSCIEFGMGDQPFRLLLSLATSFNVRNGSSFSGFNGTVEELLSRLQVDTGNWKLQPFEACAEEPLVYYMGQASETDESFSILMCYKASCVVFSPQNVNCSAYPSDEGDGTMHGRMHLRAGYAVVKLRPECTLPMYSHQYLDAEYLAYSQYPSTLVSCLFSAGQVCNVTIFPKPNLAATAAGDRLITVSSVSIWSSTKGHETTEFQQAAQPRLRACVVPLTSVSLYTSFDATTNDSTQDVAPPQTIQIRARAYLSSYISEHNLAFTTAQGPATDLYTFIALIVSTAISVILAVSWPFTDFLLKKICRKRPLYLDSRKGAGTRITRSSAKVCLQVICNLIISIVFFLPVLSVAYNELQREQAFCTWDLGSSDLDVYDPPYQTNGQKLRVVYLLSACSNYESHFLTAITLVVGVSCFTVAVCTAWRCTQIFKRYRLLQEYADMGGSGAARRRLIYGDEHAAGLIQLQIRAFKAIEMTEAEYLDIARKSAKLRLRICMQQPAAAGCSPQSKYRTRPARGTA